MEKGEEEKEEEEKEEEEKRQVRTPCVKMAGLPDSSIVSISSLVVDRPARGTQAEEQRHCTRESGTEEASN